MRPTQQVAVAAPDFDQISLPDRYLALVCDRSKVVEKTIDKYGDSSLENYLSTILTFSENPLQPRNDLLEAIYQYATPLLGKEVAEKVAQELETLPAVLTANHHGVDYMAQSVQGSLIFSLREVSGKPAKTVPIFACGNVPLDNPTYPQGLLLYNADLQAKEFISPIKLPVFSNRRRRESVSITAGYDTATMQRAQKRLATMAKEKQIFPTVAQAVANIFNEDYLRDSVVGLESYSQQAVVLNNRIWKRCFREPESTPEMVYLELEKVASLLLETDLKDQHGLTWHIMFDPTLRDEVLSQLDGYKACWNRSALSRRNYLDLADKESVLGKCGTTFFWAINEAGRRVPLLLDRIGNEAVLQGRDDRGKLWTIPFNPQDILQGLHAGRLLPSLFTCFLTISLVRGISCCGGYFQADYLQHMQNGLATAMGRLSGLREPADFIMQVPCNIYLSGMQTIMRELDGELSLPAGPLEMIASGGLTQGNIDRVRQINVRDAHLAALTETLPDMQCCKELPDDWCFLLSQESTHILYDRVVFV